MNPSQRPRRLALLIVLGTIFTPGSVCAEDPDRERDLRRAIEEQQKQLDEQRSSLEELRMQLRDLVRQPVSGSAAPAAPDPADPTPGPELDRAGADVGPSAAPTLPLSQLDKHDRRHPTGSNYRIGDHSRTLGLPWDTELGLHGFAELQVMHDDNGFDNNQFDTLDIPVDGGPAQTSFNVNPSRLELSSQTRADAFRFDAFVSMDFNGEPDTPGPRLRQA